MSRASGWAAAHGTSLAARPRLSLPGYKHPQAVVGDEGELVLHVDRFNPGDIPLLVEWLRETWLEEGVLRISLTAGERIE